jgi:hypothetical protein
MTFYGYVRNGCIVVDGAINLPNGTKVTVEPLNDPSDMTSTTMYDRWKSIVGTAKHLPPDASTKIDEVLYGRTGE